ncbi:hypothetical protein QT17_12460 [Thermus sp. 2.9]|nr:hypothetical protein QT17_12460 [Thermus sp. 2.9]
MHIPNFIFLTNPPSKSNVQDGIMRGVQLHEMLPRKGIATLTEAPTIQALANQLHEMLPRKGIATEADVGGSGLVAQEGNVADHGLAGKGDGLEVGL